MYNNVMMLGIFIMITMATELSTTKGSVTKAGVAQLVEQLICNQ
jgi:hypothetical protein